MYVDPLIGINTQQRVSKAKKTQPASVARTAPAKTMAAATTSAAAAKTPAADAVKSTDAGKKAESVDEVLGRQVEIAKESEGAVTLSIAADDQLVDAQKNIDVERLRKIMDQMMATLPNSEAKFGIHEKTNRITIKLVDKNTHEVIKEIPPEKTLDLLAKRMELAGVLLDQRR